MKSLGAGVGVAGDVFSADIGAVTLRRPPPGCNGAVSGTHTHLRERRIVGPPLVGGPRSRSMRPGQKGRPYSPDAAIRRFSSASVTFFPASISRMRREISFCHSGLSCLARDKWRECLLAGGITEVGLMRILSGVRARFPFVPEVRGGCEHRLVGNALSRIEMYFELVEVENQVTGRRRDLHRHCGRFR